MESIITTDFSKVTLSSKFLSLKTPKGELEIDIKQLLKEPINSDSAFFNATQIAKMYSKNINEYMRRESTKEYIRKKEELLNMGKTTYLKLTKTVRGKYNSGTWIHSKVILHFLRWIDMDFEIMMDDFIEKLITHSNELKIERSNTKIHFIPLAEAIKDTYIPSQESDNAKKFAYQNISTLINMKALGMSGAKYKKDNNISKEAELRDILPKEILKKIDETELDLFGYIKYAGVTDYETLKEKIGV